MSAGRERRMRCKPGDRCRIAVSGPMNLGKIVLVVRPYQAGEDVGGGRDWIPDGPDGGLHWVVASLGAGLHVTTYENHRVVAAETVMIMPIADERLQPLDDNEGRPQESALYQAPRIRTDRVPEEGVTA